MSPQRWQEVKDLFARTVALPRGERPAFLDRECDGDGELRAEIEGLLDSDETTDSLLDGGRMVAAVGSLLEHDARLGAAGRQIGNYRLLRELGRGGMAVVYAAARADDQYEKEVAIKLIKRGLDSGPMVERFLQERQILANLDHPNIARLHDGGVTADGSPYLVMERIEGERIDVYCDQGALDTEARLELFRTVCSAVQFAHQNLVVHRDLKPSNILVTRDGTPKLLDFGIAKLLEPGDAPHAAGVTVLGQRPMTPDYASPEQILGQPITTASDVYSLGVVLYRLLTGHRPYRLAQHTRREIERAICEHEPERPSTVVVRPEIEPAAEGAAATVTHTASEIGSLRGATPERLRRTLRGDLDNIVMMAMEKSPERRYASAEQLAEDLRRYLDGLPVLARKDTPLYRAGKFVRRHRLGVAAAALIALSLIGGIVATAWQAKAATQERDTAQAVSQFLTELFKGAEPGEALGEEPTAGELLQRGARKIEYELADQPEVRATLLDTIGQAFGELGRYEDAESLLGKALAIRREHLPADHPDVATSLTSLGVVERAQRPRDPKAEELLRRALAIRRAKLGPRHESVAESERNLALAVLTRGRFDEAESILRQSLGWQRERLGTEHESVALTLNDLALVLEQRSRLEEAESLIREALAINRALYREGHPAVTTARKNLADILRSRGAAAEARSIYEQILTLERKVLGPRHPAVANTLNNLAGCLVDMNQLDQAEALIHESIEIRRESLGPEHPDVAEGLNNLARIVHLKQKYPEAEELSREALSILRTRGDPHHPNVAVALNSLAASIQMGGGDLAEAHDYYLQALEINRRAFGEDHDDVADNLNNLGNVSNLRGELAEAEDYYRQALTIKVDLLGQSHVSIAAFRKNLAELLFRMGKLDEAEDEFRKSLALYRELLGEHGRMVAFVQSWLGRLLMAQGREQEAEKELRQAVTIWVAQGPSGTIGAAITQSHLGSCLELLGRGEEAETLLTDSYQTLAVKLPLGQPERDAALLRLIELYENRGDSTEARRYRRMLR